MTFPLDLFRPRLEFVGPRLTPSDEWERESIGEITFKPLLWSRDLPSKAGFFFRRRPGAARITWKVVEVWESDDGELLAGWTDISKQPLSTYTGWEFCGPLPEPYEPRGPRWGA